MKKGSAFILIFSIALCLDVSSQTGAIQKKDSTAKSEYLQLGSSFDLFYGYKFFRSGFGSKFNTSKTFNLSSPVQIITLGNTGPVNINRAYSGYGHIMYGQVVPQPVWINDTINCMITGGIVSLALGGYFHSKSDRFYFNFYGGFNTGRLRFYQNELVRQKNPFFSPKIGIQPKIQIGRFVLTLILETEYDISKLNWRKTRFANKDKITIDRFNQTGYTALLGISYKFIKYAVANDSGPESDDDF